MDKIGIDQLIIEASIGVYEHEKKNKQMVLVSLQLDCDLSLAKYSDQLSDTIDYDQVVATVKKISHAKHYNLVEHFAFNVSKAVLLSQPLIHVCSIRLEKPTAIPSCKTCWIEMTLSRSQVE